MSLIVKPGDTPPPPTVDRSTQQRAELKIRQTAARMLIEENTERKLWDTLQAKDIDPRIVEQVADMLATSADTRYIRRELGLQNDRAWRKVLAAVRGGIRVNGTALMARWLTQNEKIAGLMQSLIERELEQMQNGTDTVDAEGRPVKKYAGFSKEITMAVDAINRLRQGTVKLGKELGVYEQPGEAGKGGGGVTIVVQSGVPFPTAEAIAKSQAESREQNRELVEKSKAIEVKGTPVGQPKT
jgi:hypothetical protein